MESLLSPTRVRPTHSARISACSEVLYRHTAEPLEFLDLTEDVAACVRRSRIADGVVSVQSRHTTAAIAVNEHEPLLLADLRERLEQFAPAGAGYRHDDFAIRTHNMTPEERPNGHAHVRALVLPSSVSLNLVDGVLQLGRWQRIFLIELDCARPREVSVLVLGIGY